MKKLAFSIIFMLCVMGAMAQDFTPELEFVLDLKVKIANGFGVGTIPTGVRTVVPITGGTFEGPNIKGEVMSGGADYQLHSTTTQQSEVNAIYTIRTDDGVNIFINNRGIISEGGKYFFTSPHFEAPVDSKYAWLNSAIFVCRPIGFGEGEIILRVWKVK